MHACFGKAAVGVGKYRTAWNRQLIQTPIGSFSDAPSLSLSTVGIHLGKQAPLLEC